MNEYKKNYPPSCGGGETYNRIKTILGYKI